MFEQSLRFGQAGESVIATWLRSRGRAVMPVYEKLMDTGKGPQIFMPEGSLIAPDLFTWGGSAPCWIEAKHKTAFSWHRLSGQWVTGIDIRHYEDYCRVGEMSPWPVWMLFLHRGGHAKDSPENSPAGLYGQNLATLRASENHRSSNHGRSGMVYWAEAALKKLAPIEEMVP